MSALYRDSIDNKKVLGFVGKIYGGNTGTSSSCHMCVIKVDNRDGLIKELKKNGIYPGVHYYPNHLYPMYSKFYRKLDVAEEVWTQVITLPLHLYIGMWEVKEIVGVINEW